MLLSEQQRTTLADNLQTLYFEDGDYIIREGDKASDFYILMEGTI